MNWVRSLVLVLILSLVELILAAAGPLYASQLTKEGTKVMVPMPIFRLVYLDRQPVYALGTLHVATFDALPKKWAQRLFNLRWLMTESDIPLPAELLKSNDPAVAQLIAAFKSGMDETLKSRARKGKVPLVFLETVEDFAALGVSNVYAPPTGTQRQAAAATTTATTAVNVSDIFLDVFAEPLKDHAYIETLAKPLRAGRNKRWLPSILQVLERSPQRDDEEEKDPFISCEPISLIAVGGLHLVGTRASAGLLALLLEHGVRIDQGYDPDPSREAIVWHPLHASARVGS